MAIRSVFMLVLACALPCGAARAADAPLVDAGVRGAFGELVTAAASDLGAFDVVSSADLRRVVELEANKQVAGCTEGASCLAEVAGAMGARYVIFGQVGTLGSQILLTLNLFDSSLGRSEKRVVVTAASVDEMTGKIAPAVRELLAAAAAPAAVAPQTEKVRLLVMDLTAPDGTQPKDTAPPPAPPPDDAALPLGAWLLIGAGGGGVVGAGLLGAGALFGYFATQEQDTAKTAAFQDDAVAALARRDTNALIANSLFVGGGVVLVAAGACAAAAPFLWGGE
jgi:hypothetical protein